MKTNIDLASKVSAEVELKELGSHYEAINDAVR